MSYEDSNVETERTRLRSRLEDEKMERARERQQSSGEMIKLMGLVDQQSAEVDNLTKKLADTSTREDPRVSDLLQALEDQTETHREEVEMLEKKRSDDLTALWDEHWRRVNEIEEHRSEQDNYACRLRETLREMEKENDDLEQKLRGAQPNNQQVSALEDDLAAALELNSEKDQKIKQLHRDLEQRIDKTRILEENVHNTKDELITTRRALDEYKQKLEHSPRHIEQMKHRYEDSIAALQEELKFFKAKDEDAAQLKDLVATQKDLLIARNKQIESLNKQLNGMQQTVGQRENVEQLQQKLLTEKQQENDNLLSLVEEQREQLGKLSWDPRDGHKWEKSSAGSQKPPRHHRRDPFERETQSVKDGRHSFHRSGSSERGGYDSDNYSRRSGSVVDHRSRTPSRKEWESTDYQRQPPHRGVSATSSNIIHRESGSRRNSFSSDANGGYPAGESSQSTNSGNNELRSIMSRRREPVVTHRRNPSVSSSLSERNERIDIDRDRERDYPSDSKPRWKATEESSRLEQLKAQLQEARSERLMQMRKRVM